MNRLIIALTALILLFGYSNCMNSGFQSTAGQNSAAASAVPTPVPFEAGTNQMQVSVGTCGYINQPCVSVTLCQPGTSNCQTIPNILLDTGSYGLRLFKEKVTLTLNPVTDGSGNPLAECMAYAGGNSQWGPVVRADVQLGSETAANIPIEVIDPTFGNIPTSCKNTQATPGSLGFNGILGVGLFMQDCGPNCANSATNNVYFSCSGSTCTSTAAPLDSQVVNPVAKLPTSNNGVMLHLPGVSDSGAPNVQGVLYLGVATAQDNTPSGSVTVFPVDGGGNFHTVLNGTTYSSAFIDSGSNVIFFPSSSLPTTCNRAQGYYCPPTLQSFSATQAGSSGTPSQVVNFNIMNADAALDPNNPNYVFNNVGGPLGNSFDWGLPFFLGRMVYVGLEGRSSSLGTGPYWAW